MQTAVNRFLSRKFIAAMSALSSATWLVYSGHIADGVYSAVVIATVAAYITGNVTQKALTKDAP
jgi:hypothetical protein